MVSLSRNSAVIDILPEWFNRCHWNPDPASPLIAVKYDKFKLNFVDPEKQALLLKDYLKIPGHSR